MKAPEMILEAIVKLMTELMGDALVGIYVHGSYAFGCFRWETSDIDYLAVLNRPMTLAEKERYIVELCKINEEAPPKGIEMSVLLERDCRHFTHPTPYDLHFSNAHLEVVRADLTAYCMRMHGLDPDLAAHITVTRAVGIPLCGKPIEEVFAPVPPEAYLDSIYRDIENAATDILENPIYITLNLCRVLAYIREGSVLSKAQGGEWGLTHLPERYHAVVEDALFGYTSDHPCPAEPKREVLTDFAGYMLGQIMPERDE